jgi:hypothetical protein
MKLSAYNPSHASLPHEIARRQGVRKPAIHIPMPVMFLGAAIAQTLLPNPPVTVGQLRMLREGSTCDITVMKPVFGIEPRRFWRRKHGSSFPGGWTVNSSSSASKQIRHQNIRSRIYEDISFGRLGCAGAAGWVFAQRPAGCYRGSE